MLINALLKLQAGLYLSLSKQNWKHELDEQVISLYLGIKKNKILFVRDCDSNQTLWLILTTFFTQVFGFKTQLSR